MSGNNSNDVLAEQIRQINATMGKIESQLDSVSSSMAQFVEFRKEAEFLNQKLSKLEQSRNHQIEEIRELQLKVNSQQTLNKIIQTLTGIGASTGLAIAIFIAGSNRATDAQINTMDSDIKLLRYQVTQNLSKPSVQVNTNDGKKQD